MEPDETIQRILLNTRTIAVVGLSSRLERAGYYVPAYLQSQGYRIIPVNPNLEQALGEKSYPALHAIPEPVDLVLVFRRSEEVLPFARQAVQIGAKALWMQTGIFNAEAAQVVQQAGLDVIMDRCMMVEHRQRLRMA